MNWNHGRQMLNRGLNLEMNELHRGPQREQGTRGVAQLPCLPCGLRSVYWASVAAFLIIVTASSAHAQQTQIADASVQQAAFDRSATSDKIPQSIHFGRRQVQVGDETEQTIALEMRLTLNMRKVNELIGRNQSIVRTNQRRVITTTAVDDGRSTAVTVRFPKATKEVVGAPDGVPSPAPPAAAAATQTSLTSQPVEGKTYHCLREPGENGRLVVTDEAGNRPPTEEYEIVAQQMEMVGRSNPLAQFLSGRSVAIGEQLEVPKDIAKQIFNLGNKFGEVTRFTLTLQKSQPENGADCATFAAAVEAASSDAAQMRMLVEGPLVVQVDNCRAVRIGLVGPIGMSETRGSYSNSYQVIGTGRLQMNIASLYRDTK